MSLLRGSGRGRAFLRFVFAVLWLAAAYFLADKAAHGFSRGVAFPLIRNLFNIFLLIVGFGYMEMAWDNTREPLRAMGLATKPGAPREFAVGTALGWGMVTAVLLIVVLGGHFYVRLWSTPHAWSLLVLQVLTLAAGSLAAEIGFRGYPFQKLVQTTGPISATLLAAIFFGLLRMGTPGAAPAAMWISAMAAVLLSVAYLRTRALWLCWGLHFAWLASIGILFGQPLAGSRQASSVIRSYVDGPTWLTGSEYGPEASIVTLVVLWIGLYLLVRITRSLARTYTGARLEAADLPTNINSSGASRNPPAGTDTRGVDLVQTVPSGPSAVSGAIAPSIQIQERTPDGSLVFQPADSPEDSGVRLK